MYEDDGAVRRHVGRRVGALRRERGMTLRQLADLLGWPQDTLVNYEYGRRPITVERLVALAQTLGCTPAALLVGDDDTAAVIETMSSNPGITPQIVNFIKELGEPYGPLVQAPADQK